MATHSLDAHCERDRRWTSYRAVALAACLLFLLVGGCGLRNEGFTNARKAVGSGQELVELLRSIKDADSAKAVIADVDARYQEMITAQKEVIAYETEHGETRGSKRDIDKLTADMASLQSDLEREGERLRNVPGLPVEFWRVMRKHSYTIAEMTINYMIKLGQVPDASMGQELISICTLYRDLPREQIVEAGFPLDHFNGKSAIDLLRARLPAGTRMHGFEMDGEQLVVMGPITMDQLVKAADFATVEKRYDEAGEVGFRWGGSGGANGEINANVEEMREGFEQALADAEAQAQEAPAVLLEPPVEFEASHRDAMTQHGPGAVLRYELVNYPDLVKEGTAGKVHDVMRMFATETGDYRTAEQYGWVAPVQTYPAICGYLATFAEVVEQDNAKQTVKLKVDPSRLPSQQDEGLLKLTGMWVPSGNDPKYYKHLSELMWDPEKMRVNAAAVDSLLAVPDVGAMEKEVRKVVARNFRAIAVEDTIANEKAIRGLVHYGGKYSVPVLIEILKRPSSPVKQEVIVALAMLQDVRGAKALVEQMEIGSERHTAFEALQEMGPVAEAPVIDAVTSENPELSKAAIELLGKMGTKKSFPALRKLTRNKDEEVAELAKKSLMAAIDRQKAAKARGGK